MRKLVSFVMCFIISSIICFTIFVLLFRTSLFKSLDVLMYKGMLYIFICVVLDLILCNILRIKVFKNLSGFDVFSIVVMFCSITFSFLILVPVTVERSVSVYMLSTMDETGREYTREDMEMEFINVYVKDFGAFDKRFNEQIATGTIDKTSNGKYVINDRGRAMVKFFRIISNLFNTDKKLVYPKEAFDNN